MKSVCQLCSQEKDDCISIDERIVCPTCKPAFVQALKEGVELIGKDCWAKDDELVIRSGAVLPERCLKCNQPANGRRKEKKLIFQATTIPILGALILTFGRLIGKRTKLTYSLCGGCGRKVIIGRVLFVAAFVCLYGSAAAAKAFNQNKLILAGWAALFLLGWLSSRLAFVGAYTSSQGEYDIVKGAGEPFLSSLPKFSEIGVEQKPSADEPQT